MGEETQEAQMDSPSFLGTWNLWIFTSFIALLTVALLYDKSAKFRYYMKFAIYVMVCSCAALIMIPPSLFRPKDVRNVL